MELTIKVSGRYYTFYGVRYVTYDEGGDCPSIDIYHGKHDVATFIGDIETMTAQKEKTSDKPIQNCSCSEA